MTKLYSPALALLLALCTSGFAADADFVQLFASAKAAQKVVVYGAKGVTCVRPQKIELDKLVSKCDHFFLKTAHALNGDQTKIVLETFGKMEGLTALQGPKQWTTPFAPELCIEWTVDGKSTQVLVCFYTCEVKAIGPDFKLHCDFRGKPHEELRKTLSMYIPSSPEDE